MLVQLVNSLNLVGVPSTAAPGDMISPRVVPDLRATINGLPNPLLTGLAESDPLAVIDADLRPILAYLAATLGFDVHGLMKAVEFTPVPAERKAADLDPEATIDHVLGHLIPTGLGAGLVTSTDVEGLITRLEGALTFTPGEIASTVTATISSAAALAAVPAATLTFRVSDGAGNALTPGNEFFTSVDPFVPDVVLTPAVFDTVGNPPLTVRRNFFCDVVISFQPIGGGPAETIARTLGPIPLDLTTTLVPVIAVLTEHAVTDSRFPGRVFMGVPDNSPVGSAGDAFATLGELQNLLSNLTTVLGFLGIAVPSTLTSAVSTLTSVIGLSPGRFRKGDLIGFWEWRFGIPPWDDWQGIFSTSFIFGPSMRRAFIGDPGGALGFEGFSLFPAALGVGAIPDLSPFPLVATVGTARQDQPPPPAVPSGGTFNDHATSINFPVP
jgi:hypothetical protein